MVLAVLHMVEFVEVAEGVLELQITFGPIQIVFFSKIDHETCFKCLFLIKDSLLVEHLEDDFEGVIEVLGVDIMT